MIKKLIPAILLALSASFGFAQQNQIPFEVYNVAEGLPEEFVRIIVQDDKGFIWAATQNGLIKYDGYQFKVYGQNHDKIDTTGLQLRNTYSGLFKGRDGKIWIGESFGRGGVACFDPATETFRHFYVSDDNKVNTDESVSILLFEDEDGNIWFKNGSIISGQAIGNITATYRLNPATGVIKMYPIKDLNGANFFRSGKGTIESSGTIWLLDDKNNLNKWNREKDNFEIVIPGGKSLSPSSASDSLTGLSEGAEGSILLSSSHGLYMFDAKNQKFIKSYEHTPGDANSISDLIARDVNFVNGQIWVSHVGGKLSMIDPATENIEVFTYGSGPLAYQKGVDSIWLFTHPYPTKEGIWYQAIGWDRRVKFFVNYHFGTKKFNVYDYNFNLAANPFLTDRILYAFLEDHTGLLWLGTRPGLYKQSPKKNLLGLFRNSADNPNSIPSDSIQYLFEDSKKRLWIGTRNGLALYQHDQDNFRVFRNNPANAASLSDNNVTIVQEAADGKIWIGTANGLNHWQESSGTFKRFFYNPVETNRVEFIKSDKQQRLWLSIRDKGVFILDKNTGRVLKSFEPETNNPASLTSKQINVFYQDSRGKIWLGDGGDNEFGLYKLNSSEDGFTHYLPIPGDSTSISSREITFVAEDGTQHLWIGTDGGLNLYDYERNQFTRFTSSGLHSIESFATDKEGKPWFGTYSSGGLVAVDTERNLTKSFGESEGLLHNDLNNYSVNNTITKDDFGRFWLPTQRGLSVFDPETESFASYFEKDGFQPYDRIYSTLKTSNGDIWIGGYHGLNHIVPNNLLTKDPTLPSIVITQVAINDSSYSKPDGIIFKKSVAYTSEIKLEYWQKDLIFDFVALHYLRSEDNQYSWKLENYDNDWSTPSKERKASYTNLSPGNYIFRVKASNSDGVWNEEGISLSITILPPWWLTWWAYLLYALLFLFALQIFSKWRERRLRQEKEQLQEKVEERTTELKTSLENLKSTQAQLIQSEKMASLGELTAGIAHEIQNPLNFVNNFSEVSNELLDELDQEIEKQDWEEVKAIKGDLKDNLFKITQHGKRADAIVKSMLEHSKRGSGQKEPTDLNALADDFLRMTYQSFLAKDPDFKVELQTNLDPDLPKISVIPQDIGKVLHNLFNNAFYAVQVKANSENVGSDYTPMINVSTCQIPPEGGKGGYIEISVRDNGSGIPDSIKEKIFQPFFTTKPTGSGTGLGLSLSYDIVKAHGGELKVKTSEWSEFVIFLPIV